MGLPKATEAKKLAGWQPSSSWNAGEVKPFAQTGQQPFNTSFVTDVKFRFTMAASGVAGCRVVAELPTHYIFSYGSNSGRQLAARVFAESLPSWPAKVRNYTRIFCLHSHNWEGGVASIFPCDGREVHGSVTQLTPAQLVQLDKFEGAYTRRAVMAEVTLHGGVETHMVASSAYVANNPAFVCPPSATYLTAIHKMLKEQFPSDPCAVPITRLVDSTLDNHQPTEELSVFHPPAERRHMPLKSLVYDLGTSLSQPWVMPITVVKVCQQVRVG